MYRNHACMSISESASFGLVDEVWCRMDEGMISAVRRCLSEGGGVGGTGSSCDLPIGVTRFLGCEEVGRFRIWERGGGVVG